MASSLAGMPNNSNWLQTGRTATVNGTEYPVVLVPANEAQQYLTPATTQNAANATGGNGDMAGLKVLMTMMLALLSMMSKLSGSNQFSLDNVEGFDGSPGQESDTTSSSGNCDKKNKTSNISGNDVALDSETDDTNSLWPSQGNNKNKPSKFSSQGNKPGKGLETPISGKSNTKNKGQMDLSGPIPGKTENLKPRPGSATSTARDETGTQTTSGSKSGNCQNK